MSYRFKHIQSILTLFALLLVIALSSGCAPELNTESSEKFQTSLEEMILELPFEKTDDFKVAMVFYLLKSEEADLRPKNVKAESFDMYFYLMQLFASSMDMGRTAKTLAPLNGLTADDIIERYKKELKRVDSIENGEQSQ